MTLFISVISIYFITMLVVGYLSSKNIHTMEDYLIAGRRLPFVLAMPTIVATWFGAGSCMGVSGTVYTNGFYGVIADPFGCFLALIITGVFFAIPSHRSRAITISDLLAKAYGPSFERCATFLMIPFYIGTLASQILAMEYLFHIVSGGCVMIGSLLGTLVVLIYTMHGGMWAVTLTDFVQFVLLSLGLLILVPICLEHTPNLQSTLHTFLNEFTTLIPRENSNTNWSAYLGRVFMTGLGAIMGQDIIQRLMASRTKNIARYSAITGGFLYLGLALIPLFIGIAGREIFPDLEKPEQLIPLLAQQYLPPLGFALFSCSLLAAVMSTADSYLLAGTSLVINNIFLKKYPIHSEKTKILLLRVTNLLFAIIAFILALSGPRIFDFMVHSGVMLFVAIFVPTCAILFWNSTNHLAAWGALIAGTATWISFIFLNYNIMESEFEDILFSSAFKGILASLTTYLGFCFYTKIRNSRI